MSRAKILAALLWLLLSGSWTFFLVIVSGPWDAMSALAMLAALALSVVCCIALWNVLKNRQSVLLAVSLAGMASFLSSFLILFLIMGISI